MKISEQRPLIYFITEGVSTPKNFSETSAAILEKIQRAADLKIPLIQIREKKLPAKLIFEIVREAVKITRRTKTKILVNDRVDIMLAAKADGVHLTSQSLNTQIVRHSVAEKFIIGVSAHTLDDLHAAKSQGADFATFSPIFPTPSKEIYGAPQGLKKLRQVCRLLDPFPVIALGGIDEKNYREVIAGGAAGFAAIRFLNEQLIRQKFESKDLFENFKNKDETGN